MRAFAAFLLQAPAHSASTAPRRVCPASFYGWSSPPPPFFNASFMEEESPSACCLFLSCMRNEKCLRQPSFHAMAELPTALCRHPQAPALPQPPVPPHPAAHQVGPCPLLCALSGMGWFALLCCCSCPCFSYPKPLLKTWHLPWRCASQQRLHVEWRGVLVSNGWQAQCQGIGMAGWLLSFQATCLSRAAMAMANWAPATPSPSPW